MLHCFISVISSLYLRSVMWWISFYKKFPHACLPAHACKGTKIASQSVKLYYLVMQFFVLVG